MTAKTITLTGAEIRAGYSGGANAWLRNDGTDVIYAAAVPGITAGSDGVVSIPAGQSAPVYGAYGTVYLLGTGSVQLIGSDYSTNPFKTSAQSGGSGADSVARAAITAHVANTEIHVTAAQKSAWDGLSNPNLLINSDFAVNQRGQQEYTAGYSADRWKLITAHTKVTVLTGGVKIGFASDTPAPAVIGQAVENYSAVAGKEITVSMHVSEMAAQHAMMSANYMSGGERKYHTKALTAGTNALTVAVPEDISDFALWIYGADSRVGDTADSYTVVEWAKLEIGGSATPYLPPDPTTELARCQRYYQIRSTNDIAPADLRPSMGTITDIKAVEGGYAYVAEL